jgi:cell division transport system ATP-binding protein
MSLFKELHKSGISIIMATHDYNMIIKFPGKIFQCNDGKIQEVIAKKEA